MELVLALVEQVRQTLHRTDAHVMAAMGADFLVGLPVAHEQHLLALGALQPESLRRLLARDQGLELGSDEVRQPVHGGGIARTDAPAKATAVTARTGRK